MSEGNQEIQEASPSSKPNPPVRAESLSPFQRLRQLLGNLFRKGQDIPFKDAQTRLYEVFDKKPENGEGEKNEPV